MHSGHGPELREDAGTPLERTEPRPSETAGEEDDRPGPPRSGSFPDGT